MWPADLKRHLKSKHGQQKSTLKQQQPYTLTPEQQQQQLIAEEVMDFEFEKYKCWVLLRLVGTVEGFHWFRYTVRPFIIGSSSRTTTGSPKRGLGEFIE